MLNLESNNLNSWVSLKSHACSHPYHLRFNYPLNLQAISLPLDYSKVNPLHLILNSNLVLLSIGTLVRVDLLLDGGDGLVGEFLVLEHCLRISLMFLK